MGANWHYQRCPPSEIPYVAAFMRMRQTLDNVATMGPLERGHFHMCMRKHKATGHVNPANAQRLRPIRTRCQPLTARCYRFGSHGLRPWGAEMQCIMSHGSTGTNKERVIAVRVQMEYMNMCVP